MGKINLGRVVGNRIYTGMSFPQDNILDGDIFINKTNFVVYQYKNKAWETVGTLKMDLSDYVSLETFERRTEETVEFITKQIPYGDRTYVKFSHLTANNTIENLNDALVDNNYIGEDNVEYKFYIELGDGTILENIHIKSYSEYYDITSIIRNGYAFKIYIGRMWYNNPTPTITEFIAQHSQIVNYKDIENLVNYEALGDALDGIEELIPYGDRKYHYSFSLTAANTISELIDELKTYEMFDENNEGKFYIKLSDGTVLENIHIKLYVQYPAKFECCYINSIIRKLKYIKVYLNNNIRTNSTMTISDFINNHKQIATEEYVSNLIGNISTLNLQPVEVLPTENISTTTIYLLKTPNTDETNIYEEWVYVDSKWELIGTTKVELPTKVSQLENDADYIDSERLTDVVDSLEAQIQRGGRTYFYSYDLTINNTVKELISKLKSYDKFDENNEGKFYIKLSDDTVLENIHIKLKYLTKPERKTVYYINSIIREKNNIKIYIATLNDSSVLTISELINEHKAITTKDYVDNKFLAKSGGTLTGPLTVTGGDSATAGKIILDQNNNGQITNTGTQTLFGFTNAISLAVGHSSYKTNLRGSSIEALATLQTRAVLPVSTNNYNLGSSTSQWKEIHGTTIYQNGKQVATQEYVNSAIANSGGTSSGGSSGGSGKLYRHRIKLYTSYSEDDDAGTFISFVFASTDNSKPLTAAECIKMLEENDLKFTVVGDYDEIDEYSVPYMVTQLSYNSVNTGNSNIIFTICDKNNDTYYLSAKDIVLVTHTVTEI